MRTDIRGLVLIGLLGSAVFLAISSSPLGGLGVGKCLSIALGFGLSGQVSLGYFWFCLNRQEEVGQFVLLVTLLVAAGWIGWRAWTGRHRPPVNTASRPA